MKRADKNQGESLTKTQKIFIYFSDILGKDVFDCHGQRVGVLSDIAMKINGEVYPRASSLTIKRGILRKEYSQISWEHVYEIAEETRLKIELKDVAYQKTPVRNEFSLRVDILDQQVVDMDNQKVVRVNDIHLLRVDSQLYIAHVEVGLRGLVRRLAWTPFIDWAVQHFNPKAGYLKREELIPWKSTQTLSLGRTKNVLKMTVARQKLSQIPPTELAEIMEDLDKFEKLSLFKSLDVSTQRKVFADLSINEKEELIDQMDNAEIVNLLENIPADEAADLLMTLSKEQTFELMKQMHTETSKKLKKLLGFAQDTAGGLMTTEYLYLGEEALVADALKKIKENVQYPGNIFHLYIVDDKHRLVGATSIRRLIAADEKLPIMETCHPKKVFVRTDDGMEEIALLLEKYKYSAVPVLNEEDILQGVVTIDDVMEELISIAWTKYKGEL